MTLSDEMSAPREPFTNSDRSGLIFQVRRIEIESCCDCAVGLGGLRSQP